MATHNLASQGPKQHVVTVGLTDYFHAGALKGFIPHGHWPRFETRIEENTLRTLELLDRCDTKATFFVLGWIAERQPDLVREVARRGHEIGNMGYYTRSIHEMTRVEFEDDLKRSHDAVESASGRRELG
jgi:peptidoglycan/xylan/chitin deacetylase (PgdA/CDA1 family)